MRIPTNESTDLYIIAKDESSLFRTIQDNETIIRALTKLGTIHYVQKAPEQMFGSVAVQKDVQLFIPLPTGLKEKEKSRLEKERERLEANIEKLEVQLQNPQFVERAPEHLVNKQRSILAKTKQELSSIVEKLSSFQAR
jgi:valyl-tRNA synthetase